MKNFKILAIFENFLKNFGALNQNSGSTDIFALDWRTHSENLKVLAQKMKNFKILAIFENFLKNFGALNQNSGSTEIFVLIWRTHSENLKVLAQKIKKFKILSIFDNFWKFLEKFWGPKQGLRQGFFLFVFAKFRPSNAKKKFTAFARNAKINKSTFFN